MKKSDESQDLASQFETFGPAYMKWVSSLLSESGVSAARLRLLASLFHDGPQKMSQLSGRLGVSGTNITTLVDALEKETYVVRKSLEGDRRATVIHLTEKAKSEVALDMRKHRQRVARFFNETLTKDEHEVMIKCLRKLTRALQKS